MDFSVPEPSKESLFLKAVHKTISEKIDEEKERIVKEAVKQFESAVRKAVGVLL